MLKRCLWLLFVVSLAASQCVDDGKYCRRCSLSVCDADENYVFCATATGSFPSGSPCSGVSQGQKVCAGSSDEDLSRFSLSVWEKQKEDSQKEYEACLENPGANPECCTPPCTDPQECYCPKVCDGTKTIEGGLEPKPTVQLCFSDCMACDSSNGGRSEQYCKASCGEEASDKWSCSDENCCSTQYSSAGALSSWLSWKFIFNM